MKKKFPLLLKLLIIAIVLFGLIQLVPVGAGATNPQVINEPKWDSPAIRALARNSCFDCHSNETTHPWYSYIAPVSWLLAYDVVKGRAVWNFSEWPTDPAMQKAIARSMLIMVESGRMPPQRYLLLHPGAKMTSAQAQQLVNGLGIAQ